jgi:hypothetical protein
VEKAAKTKFVPIVEERPPPASAIHGRGASWSPANRFEKLHVDLRDADFVDVELTDEERPRPRTQYFRDGTKTIITRNNSPDVGFETSLNPYRGCEHGCIYCYARPTHEYLGFSAGLDFESKIMVKAGAAALLRAELESPGWEPQVLVMSGVTDPYQPMRGNYVSPAAVSKCSQISQSGGDYHKNRLVTRDVDFTQAADYHAAAVNISVTSLDPKCSASSSRALLRPKPASMRSGKFAPQGFRLGHGGAIIPG